MGFLMTEQKTTMNLTKRIILIDDDPDDQLFFRDAITGNPS